MRHLFLALVATLLALASTPAHATHDWVYRFTTDYATWDGGVSDAIDDGILNGQEWYTVDVDEVNNLVKIWDAAGTAVDLPVSGTNLTINKSGVACGRSLSIDTSRLVEGTAIWIDGISVPLFLAGALKFEVWTETYYYSGLTGTSSASRRGGFWIDVMDAVVDDSELQELSISFATPGPMKTMCVNLYNLEVWTAGTT